MTDFAALDRSLVAAVGPVSAVAVSYLTAPPEGVPRFEGVVPSSCSFWGRATSGAGFYTAASDHFNCPVGAYTSGIALPPERAVELEQTLSLMSSIGYVSMDEVPKIPRLPKAPAYIYYAPLAAATIAPDVVIVAGRPSSLMRLQEAATRAGAASSLPLLGRPTCMALPAALAHGSVMSTGCIGNRVYTGLGDDEMYLMLPGARLAAVVDHSAVIALANDALADYHGSRRATMNTTRL